MDDIMFFYSGGMILLILLNCFQAIKKESGRTLEFFQMFIYSGILIGYLAIFTEGSVEDLNVFYILTFVIFFALHDLEMIIFIKNLVKEKKTTVLDILSLVSSAGVVIFQVLVLLI